MEEHPVPLTADALRSEGEWVRRVARALVADPHRAEDLEQDLWVKALERPPVVRTSLRGWLRSSLRSMAADFGRSDRRRRRHEEAAAAPAASGHVPAAADLVARAEALRLVVDAVLALREPYRTTVLLRFYEDLPPAAMARRLGIPVETVRTRLRRGMEELRERFDGKGLAALLPLAFRELPVPPGGPGESGAWAGADRAGAEAAGAVREITNMGVRIFVLSGLSVAIVGAAAWWAAEEPPRPPVVPEAVPEAVVPLPANPTSPAPAVEVPVVKMVPVTVMQVETVKQAEPPTTEALLARVDLAARTPSFERKEPLDVAAALKDAEALLQRTLTPEDRAKALVAKAILHRTGPGADQALEEEALREAFNLQGEETKTGREVRFQLAWTRSRRGDEKEATDLFDRVASHPDTEPGFRATNRWEAAVRADRQGDKDRACLWYRAFIEENGSVGGEWFRRNVERAKVRLKELE